MAKSYNNIVKNFKKIITQCDKRAKELFTKEEEATVQASILQAEAADYRKERNLTVKLATRIENLIGGVE